MNTALGRAFYLDFVELLFQSAAIDAREFRAGDKNARESKIRFVHFRLPRLWLCRI